MEKYEFRTLIVDRYVEGADAVVSLAVSKDDIVYGGLTNTSGNGHILFSCDPKRDVVKDHGVILIDEWTPPWIMDRCNLKLGHHALEFGGDGNLYGATGATYGSGYADYRYLDHHGGHMIKYDLYREKAEDLGVPVPHEFVFCATIDNKGERLFCFTTPMHYFLVYDIYKRETSVKGQLRGPSGNICHDLACDDDGNVYGSYGGGRLFKYDSSDGKLIETDTKLPGQGIIDYLIKGNDNIIYGGTWDGFFFTFDPEKQKVRNLGKPVDETRLSALAISKDGKIYGCIGGMHMGGRGRTHLFVYDPKRNKMTDLGLITDSTRDSWGGDMKRAYVIHCMAMMEDGTIYAGETDRYPHLYIGRPARDYH